MPFVRFRVVQISPWKLALGAVLVFALLLTLFILAAGVFLLVLPVAAVAAALTYLFGGRTKKREFPRADPSDGVIEAEYREVEAKQLEQKKMSELVDNVEKHRYEISVDGKTAFTAYKIENGVITFVHTEVPSEFRGKGVGSKLVRGELEAARARGLKVIPRCEFVAGYIEKHPEFHDLLAAKQQLGT